MVTYDTGYFVMVFPITYIQTHTEHLGKLTHVKPLNKLQQISHDWTHSVSLNTVELSYKSVTKTHTVLKFLEF